MVISSLLLLGWTEAPGTYRTMMWGKEMLLIAKHGYLVSHGVLTGSLASPDFGILFSCALAWPFPP